MSDTATGLLRLRRETDKLLGEKAAVVRQVEQEKESLRVARGRTAAALEAQDHLQRLAQRMQQQAHRRVAGIVSRCLSAVFQKPYELRIEFERKRGRTEATFVYLRDGRKINPRVTSGGVREVASLALRLVAITLSQPPVRRLLVLDEPFSGVSDANLPRMAKLIESLSEELDMQFLVVTHSKALEVGKVIQL